MRPLVGMMTKKTYCAKVMVEFCFDVEAESEEQALEMAWDGWADSNCVPYVCEPQVWEPEEE